MRDALRTRGVPLLDHGPAFHRLLAPGVWSPAVATGIPTQFCGRPVLEAEVRRRVLARPGIRLLSGRRVTGLLFTPVGSRVTGVRHLPARDDGPAGPPAELAAGLVVDATGRTTRLPRWLAEAGYGPVAQHVVDAGTVYVSRLYRLPADPSAAWSMTVDVPGPPGRRRGGTATRIEDGRCVVSLITVRGEPAPYDEATFTAHALSLHNPHIGRVVTQGEALTPPRRFTRLESRWRRYDRLSRWPAGLLAVGDTICSLNPSLGQGVAVAARQALALRDALAARPGAAAVSGLPTRRTQRRLAALVRVPWLLATHSDLTWFPASQQPLAQRLLGRYLRSLNPLLPDNPTLYRTLLHVQHLLLPPRRLLWPSAVAHARRVRHRRGAGNPRPTAVGPRRTP